MYFTWENEEIVNTEQWQNMGLAFASVFVVTLLFLANISISMMVILCVAITIIDTIGFMHFWNVKLYFISMSYIVMAVGLCVDYSVHVAYAFLTSKGIASNIYNIHTYIHTISKHTYDVHVVEGDSKPSMTRRLVYCSFLNPVATLLGPRQEGAAEALTNIGPAVLNGGITTFIAVISLCASTTSIADIFFKVKLLL